jgi:hypothetical protein
MPSSHNCDLPAPLEATFIPFAAPVAASPNVSGVVAAAPLSVTLDASEQVYAAGGAVPPVAHVKFTGPVKPSSGVKVTVPVPGLPPANETGFGVTATVKSDAVSATFGESAGIQLLSPR